jgi:hypothetical protein
MSKRFSFQIAFVVLALSTSLRAMAEDYTPEDGTNFLGNAHRASSGSLFFEGERALKQGNIEKAVRYLRRSVNENGTDLDARVACATALEQKYRAQTEKDPDLFVECLTHWLYAMRTIAPEEQGVGALKFLYKDEGRDMVAKTHIKKLTGSLPRPWETDKKFIARVTRGATALHGRVVPQNSDSEKADN